ncbi:MAG: protein rep [Terriglobales bacterium]
MARCHRSGFRLKKCDRGHRFVRPEESCGQRICAHCSRQRSQELVSNVNAICGEKTELRYIVFAERNCEDPSAGHKSLWAAFTRLRRSVRWSRRVKGCIAVEEMTYNAKEDTFHPHLNVLYEGDYIPFEELRRMWWKASEGRGRTAHIQKADAGTTKELLKYVTKIADFIGYPEALDKFLTAVKGMRLVRTYGSFRGVVLPDEEQPGQGQCPDCGPEVHCCIVDLGPVQAYQLTLDLKGVFRMKPAWAGEKERWKEAMQFPPTMPLARRNRPMSALEQRWDRVQREVRERLLNTARNAA